MQRQAYSCTHSQVPTPWPSASALVSSAFDPELFVAIPDTVEMQVDDLDALGHIQLH
jgi:hypothetical protein